MTTRPYKGLASFADTELDARLFFGRDRERDLLVANVLARRLTVVYGPNGVGKSSLLRAGVAQALRAQGVGAVVVHSAWAERPVEALVDAIRDSCPRLGPTAGLADTVAAAAAERGDVVLLLDQLEEYFTYHRPAALVDALAELVRRPGLRVSVLLAVRDDALAQLDAFGGRLPEIFSNLVRLERLGPGAAAEAIVGPLAAYTSLTGEPASAEPALVERLQVEVAEGLEAPYLQLVLDRLWEEDGGQLRLASLERLGGTSAIARAHVEGTLDALPAGDRLLASRLARQLVTPSGTKVALAEADLAEYAGVSRERVRPLLERLAADRVLRAVDELDERGARYEVFHDVLAAPLTAWRHQTDVRLARRAALRIAVLSLAALVVVAAVAAYALAERSTARTQARHAHAHELAARALAALPGDPSSTLRLGLQAARLSPDADAAGVLRAGLLAMRERGVIRLGGSVVAASFEGGALLAASSDGRVGLYRGAHLVLTLPLQRGLTHAVASADGALIATGDSAGTATIWDARTGGALKTVRTTAPIAALSFVGHVLLVGSGAHVRVVHGTHGTTRNLRVGGAVVAAALRADLQTVAVAWKRGGRVTTQLVDVRSGKVRATLPERGISVLAFHGTLLATGSTDKTARLWDARGKLRHVLAQRGHILSLRFSADGRTLVTTSADGSAAVWDVPSAARRLLLVGATGAAEDAAIAPDGSEYAVAFADRVARIYDGIDGRILAPLAGHADAVTSIDFDPAGRVLATGGTDGTVRLWDASPSAQLTPTPLRIPTGVPARVVSPDGTVAATRKARDAFLVDAATGHVLHVLRGHRSLVTDAAFSPDGKLLVTSSVDHDARIWDVRTGRLLHVLRGHFLPVNAAAFSPDGHWVVTASQFTAGLWDAQTGGLVEYLRGAPGPLANAAFEPNGTTIVTVGKDGTFRAAQCVVCRDLPGLEQAARARLAALR